MKIVYRINLVLLTLLSLSTGIFKILQEEADVQLFEKIGFGILATTFLGVLQFIGGILLIIPRTRLTGAYVMLPTFALASFAVFANSMMIFGVVSLLFIAMSILEITRQKQINE